MFDIFFVLQMYNNSRYKNQSIVIPSQEHSNQSLEYG
jgi:hypothetical protein